MTPQRKAILENLLEIAVAELGTVAPSAAKASLIRECRILSAELDDGGVVGSVVDEIASERARRRAEAET
jgi:hypothetical protein